MLDDGKAQTSAASAAVATGVHAVETLGEVGNMFGLKPRTIIADRHIDTRATAPGTDVHLATRRSVFYRVDHQIRKGAVQLLAIAHDLQPRRAIQAQALLLFLRQYLALSPNGLQHW